MTDLTILTATPYSPRLQVLKDACGRVRVSFEILSLNNPAESIEGANLILLHWSESSGPVHQYQHLVGIQQSYDVKSLLLDDVAIPPSFKQLPTLDLTQWDGHLNDPAFQQLVRSIREAPDRFSRHFRRRKGRLLSGVTGVSAALFAYAFLSDFLQLQESICSVSVLQPRASDFCGAHGLGGQPTKEERLAWADVPLTDCNALRDHVSRFPGGAFRDEAADILGARRIARTESWADEQMRLPLFVTGGAEVYPSESEAQRATLQQATVPAQRLCDNFGVTSSYRVDGAEPQVQSWRCSVGSSGTTCSLDGWAMCDVSKRVVEEIEICGQPLE